MVFRPLLALARSDRDEVRRRIFMVSNRLYYTLKPYLPWSLRLAVRRRVAARQRANSAGSWPIKESAGKKPDGWTGWPNGKKFALVLTHDVEGPKGLAQSEQVAQLEAGSGFKSS